MGAPAFLASGLALDETVEEDEPELPPIPPEAAQAPPPPAPPPVTLETEEGADLQGFFPTPADLLLDSVYGDHVHSNDGTHLNGDILDDRLWQSLWKRMVQISPTRYSVPKGAVRKRFLTILRHEWHQVRDRMDNGWMDGCSYVFFAVVVCLLPPSR